MPIHLRRSERSRTRNSHESQGCVVAFKTLPPQWALWYVSSLVRQTKRDNKSNKNLLFNSIRAVPLWWAFQCLIGSGQCFIAILSLSNCWLSRQFSKIRFGCDSLAQTKLSAVTSGTPGSSPFHLHNHFFTHFCWAAAAAPFLLLFSATGSTSFCRCSSCCACSSSAKWIAFIRAKSLQGCNFMLLMLFLNPSSEESSCSMSTGHLARGMDGCSLNPHALVAP